MPTKIKKIIFFTLFLIFSFAVPVVAIFVRYDLFRLFFETSFKNQVTVVLSVLVVVIALYYRDPIKKFLDKLPLSLFKFLIEGAKNTLVLIGALILVVNIIIKGGPEDLIYISGWILGSNMISLFIFEPLWKHYEKLEVIENDSSVEEN